MKRVRLDVDIAALGDELSVSSLNVEGQKFEGAVNDGIMRGIFDIAPIRYDGKRAPPFPPAFGERTDHVALCRAVGIPARLVSGAMYTPVYGGSFGQHVWVEAYMGASGALLDRSTPHLSLSRQRKENRHRRVYNHEKGRIPGSERPFLHSAISLPTLKGSSQTIIGLDGGPLYYHARGKASALRCCPWRSKWES